MKIPIHNHKDIGGPDDRTPGCPACDEWFDSLAVVMDELFDIMHGNTDAE